MQNSIDQKLNSEIIFAFPFPISVNESLMPIGGRLVKTTKARTYAKKAVAYADTMPAMPRFRLQIANWIDEQKTLRVDTFFIWPKDSIFTKGKTAKSWVKKIDAHNRIKQLHDALSEVLQVDDMYFFAGDTEKVYSDVCTNPFCIVKIQPMTPRSIYEIGIKAKDLEI